MPGQTKAGFQTPSTNFLPYTVNEDGSVSYQEQGKTITVSCSEEGVTNLYEIIQPYTSTNSINDGFSGYEYLNFINKDAQHTTYNASEDQNFYGVWFQYDLSQLTSFNPNKIRINHSGSGDFVIVGSNDTITWFSTYFVQKIAYDTMYETNGATSYMYYRFIALYARNDSDFTISSIQFIDDLLLSSSSFGTCSTNVSGVKLGSYDKPLQLRYSTIERNINGYLGTGAIGTDLLLDTDLDNTYPPTSTAINKSITANVATQLYNAIIPDKFYLAYVLPYSQTVTLNTWYPFFNYNSEVEILPNGFTLSSVLNLGKITIPFTGIYSKPTAFISF